MKRKERKERENEKTIDSIQTGFLRICYSAAILVCLMPRVLFILFSLFFYWCVGLFYYVINDCVYVLCGLYALVLALALALALHNMRYILTLYLYDCTLWVCCCFRNPTNICYLLSFN